MSIDQTQRLTERERKILQFLDAWPWKTGGTLIGGYAIAAYGPPRFSKDADIVIPVSLQSTFETFLHEQGYGLEGRNLPNLPDFEFNALRYQKDGATIDLLIGSVRDRKAKIDVPEEWIRKDSRTMKLHTLRGATSSLVNVARPSAIWVLKLQAGRDQDLLDLYAIWDAPFEIEEVITLFRSFHSETLKEKLSFISRKLREKKSSDKLFEDAMSRIGRKQTKENRRRWEAFIGIVEHIVSESTKS